MEVTWPGIEPAAVAPQENTPLYSILYSTFLDRQILVYALVSVIMRQSPSGFSAQDLACNKHSINVGVNEQDRQMWSRIWDGSGGYSSKKLITFFFFRATPVAYGSSQARGRIRAEPASLHHSHSSVGSEPLLQPTPLLTATPDP